MTTDIVVSFDTTGSMYPCLTQVRRNVEGLAKTLFDTIPDLRLGIIAHGDYCDEGYSYVIKVFDLSPDKEAVCKFVRTVGQTGGGDAPECYELVLWQARSLTWRTGGHRALVMIGDDNPHEPSYRLNTKNLDWRNELKVLQEMGVNIFGVHALAPYRQHAKRFWQEISKMTGGTYLTLDQFYEIEYVLKAVAYHQSGSDEFMTKFEQELVDGKKMTMGMAGTFESLTGRRPTVTAFGSSTSTAGRVSYSARVSTSKADEEELKAYGDVSLEPVPPGRFQRLRVDADIPIKGFVEENVGSGSFAKGSGYYQFGRKKVKVQKYKKVVLVHKATNAMFSGPAARKMLGLPKDRDCDLSPRSVRLAEFHVFIQSTSVNRKLLAGDEFLYEVAEFAAAA